MDQTRPPHLSKKRPAVVIDGEAKPLAEDISPQADAAAEATPESEPAPAPEKPAPQPAPEKRPGRASGFTGGVIGAVLALAGGYGLQAAGVLPAPDNGAARLAALESQIAALETGPAGETEAAIAALGERVAALAANGAEALTARIDALEAKAGGASADPVLIERVSVLEARLAEGGGAALEDVRTELLAEIAALKSEISALRTSTEASANAPGLAAAVAATALRAAVDRGGPFNAELETLAALQPGSAAVAALRNFAASGVPVRTDILASYEDAASVMLAADAPVNPDAGLIDRLISSAKGLVRVRPVGAPEGDSTGARIARLGEALRKQDDAAVEAEFAALPAAVRAAGTPFMERFRARAEADRLIAEAVKAATAPGSGS